MPTEISIVGRTVLEYLDKYPTFSSKYLSELIYNENPGMFTNPEHVRTTIRYYRGTCGDIKRKDLDLEHYRPKLSMPESQEEKFKIITLDNNSYPLWVGSDAHVPYHDQDALEISFEYGHKRKCKTIILNGDWLDFFAISKFSIDPTKLKIKEEIEILAKILKDIKAYFPSGTRIIYKIGNHEERFDRYLMNKAPELYSLPTTRLAFQLKLNEIGVEVIDNKCPIKIGDLFIIHGHEYRFAISNPVNPARGLYLRAKKSAICGHFHQTSEHTETSINGAVTATWSTGCLCGLHAEYDPLNKWNLGFAVVDAHKRGFVVENKRIISYTIV